METWRCMSCMELNDLPFCRSCGYPKNGKNDVHQLKPGTKLHQYLVGRVLGQGGFGITYIGWDTRKERPVAVKEFYPNFALNRDAEASEEVKLNTPTLEQSFTAGKNRFLREAEALSALAGIPHIVNIYDHFETNNTAYIVMEYVSGIDLKQYVQNRGGRLSVQETLWLMRPLLQTLSQVHRAGLVHRDISPDNILFQPQSGIKLLDFGAVRVMESADTETDLKKSTQAIVKQGFAPIEQYRNRGSIGPWMDIYALCATIYYCLTGQIPPESVSRFLEEETLSWDGIPDLTPQQRHALDKGMAVQAKDRWASVEELMAGLYPDIPAPQQKTEKPASEQEKKKPAPRPKKRLPWLLATAASVAAVAIGAMLLISGSPDLPVVEETIQPTQMQSETPPTTELPTSFPPETIPKTEPPTTIPETEPPTTIPPETRILEPWERNVLKANALTAIPGDRAAIQTAIFQESSAKAPAAAVDLSADNSRSVLAWIEGTTLYIAGEGGIDGSQACPGLFAGCTKLSKIVFGTAFHSETAVSMKEMFSACTSLTYVDLENLKTGNVTDMSRMFANSSLATLRLGSWDVSRVEDMSEMFYNCRRINTLDIKKWDVSSVKNMRAMFESCILLSQVDFRNWDVSAVENMERMFSNCSMLATISIKDWNVSQVKDMSSMFSFCRNLVSLDVSRWDVSSVTDMNSMFYAMPLTQLNIADWDTSAVTNMHSMFANCSSLQNLDVSRWNVSQVTTMNSMFTSCSVLAYLDVSRWDVSQVTDMNSMFRGCGQLKNLTVRGWNVSAVKDMSYMFNGCYFLWEIDLTGWDVSGVEHFEGFMNSSWPINGRPWKEFFEKSRS